jgi:hypothetical protein
MVNNALNRYPLPDNSNYCVMHIVQGLMLATLKSTLEGGCPDGAGAADADVDIMCHLSSHMAHMGEWRRRLDLAHRILSLQVRKWTLWLFRTPVLPLSGFHVPNFDLLGFA